MANSAHSKLGLAFFSDTILHILFAIIGLFYSDRLWFDPTMITIAAIHYFEERHLAFIYHTSIPRLFITISFYSIHYSCMGSIEYWPCSA